MVTYPHIIASILRCIYLSSIKRHIILDIWSASRHTISEANHEHGYTASDPRAGGTVTPQSSGGDRASLRWPRAIFPCRRQNSSEVRDAARPSGRWAQRYDGRRATRLLAGGVLSDCRCIFRGRYAGSARRAPWPTRSTQIDSGSTEVCQLGRYNPVRCATGRRDRTSLWCEFASTHRRESASVNRRFWPVAEPSQADYESLREAVLSGRPLDNLAAARFARRGLAGLIVWPHSEPIYNAMLLGAERPPWTPYTDPRVDTLASS